MNHMKTALITLLLFSPYFGSQIQASSMSSNKLFSYAFLLKQKLQLTDSFNSPYKLSLFLSPDEKGGLGGGRGGSIFRSSWRAGEGRGGGGRGRSSKFLKGRGGYDDKLLSLTSKYLLNPRSGGGRGGSIFRGRGRGGKFLLGHERYWPKPVIVPPEP